MTFYNCRNGFGSFFSDLNQKNVFLLQIEKDVVAFGGKQCSVIVKSTVYPNGQRNVFLPCKFSGETRLAHGLVELGIIHSF